MSTGSRNRRLKLTYRHHTAVDDVFAVVLDVEVRTGRDGPKRVIIPFRKSMLSLPRQVAWPELRRPIRGMREEGAIAS
jgi:hypothetical protein